MKPEIKKQIVTLLNAGFAFLTKAGEQWQQLLSVLMAECNDEKKVLSTLTACLSDWPQKEGKDIGLSTFQKLYREAQDAGKVLEIDGKEYAEVPECVKRVNAFNVWRSKQKSFETGLLSVNENILKALMTLDKILAGELQPEQAILEDLRNTVKAAGKIDKIAEENKARIAKNPKLALAKVA